MRLLIETVLWLWALVGHVALFASAYNRLNSVFIHYRILKAVNRLSHATLGITAIGLFVWYLAASVSLQRQLVGQQGFWLPFFYVVVCWLVGGWAWLIWIERRLSPWPNVKALSNHSRHCAIDKELGQAPIGSLRTAVGVRIPGNQIFDLHICEKEVAIPRLPAALDGLSIVHLSDLHLAGHVQMAFFERVVAHANQLQGDLVAITGDVIDRDACFAWLPNTLAQLKAPLGCYFIRGNHEHRLKDLQLYRQSLTQCGLVDLGGSWKPIEHRESRIVLAGNELPWFSPSANLSDCPSRDELPQQVRILLSHSPDQLAWARANDFDVMLAGHTHGGQIRLPLIGPILCPSRHGTKYASGTFYQEPTLLHVSRGISGMSPIRLNCPPELTKLILRRG